MTAAALRDDQRAPGHRPRGPSTAHSAVQAPAAGRSVVCDINTTPLIDVLLVLLITLIMSLPIMTHAVKLDMPHGTPPLPVHPPDAIDLEIDFDGVLVWNGSALSGMQQLDGYFGVEARKDPQPEVHLRPDRRAKYGVVAQVLASAQHHGMIRIGFVNTGQFAD